MYYSTRNRRRLTLETLMTMPSEPESKAFYTYTDGDDKIEVLNDTFTLVLSRDVRKNSRIGAEIAFAIAKERPEDDVMYVNTYAGVALMKEAFSKALEKSGMTTHPPLTPPASGRGIEDQASGGDARPTRKEAPPPKEGGGWGVVQEDEENDDVSDEEDVDEEDDDDDEWQDPDDDLDDEDYGKEPSVLGNLFIHDVPFGTWDTWRLERDIIDRGRAKCHTIVVINSFEFASISRETKSRMARELLGLRSKMGLSIVVFSHDLRWDIAAGLPCRGPLGIISANAGSVQRLNDPFEHTIRHRKRSMSGENPLKDPKNSVIHEAQMRAGSPSAFPRQFQKQESYREESYRKVPKFRNEHERILWYREQESLPDYHVDPWLGQTQKLGRELVALARSSVVQRYFEEHPDFIFTKGEEPTEYELVTGTYEAKEVQKKWLI